MEQIDSRTAFKEVGLDMCMYDADIEKYPLHEVIAAIKQLRSNK
jgi:hypothetical protein